MTNIQKTNYLLAAINYCAAIAQDIIENNKSKEIQEYAKKYAEIESPLAGGTEADWIRINWGDIYVFLHDDGDVRYDLDPYGAYGAEIISITGVGINEFKQMVIDYIAENGYEFEVGNKIPMYIPFR